jgi:hypothetical protein
MRATEPETISRMAMEIASVFDATLLTTHPSELGNASESDWLVWMELPSGEEFWQYASPNLAGNKRYVEDWIHKMHSKIIRSRSVR